MELARLFLIIKKNITLILSSGVIACVFSLVFFNLKPLTYRVFFAITTCQTGIDSSADFQYDNYYSQQAISIFNESLKEWPRDPQIVKAAFEQSQSDLERLSPRQRKRIISVKKLAPNYLEISFIAKDEREARLIYDNLCRALEQKLADLGKDKIVWFKLKFSQPLITQNQWNISLVIIVSFLSGALAGLMISLLRHYFKLALSSK
ncbi:MAG: LapA family protein [Patescibacteria group bacterium]|nr:LapA family protein [Patescibacteria group bacterium]